MPKVRLDVLLVQHGLAESRAKAQALIMSGQVRVNGQIALKPATMVAPESILTVEAAPRFVSRGGEKLDAAFEAFHLDAHGLVCADVGASTGGFTDCLLQRGAARVYAIDVGKGLLHWKLRRDPRVVVMEATNARYVERLPEPVSLVTLDVSFISLKVLLPVVRHWLAPSAKGVLALIKPQFEAGRKEAARGEGVIREPEIHRRILSEVLDCAQREGLGTVGLIRSPLLGPKGNVEFLAWLLPGVEGHEVHEMIEAAL